MDCIDSKGEAIVSVYDFSSGNRERNIHLQYGDKSAFNERGWAGIISLIEDPFKIITSHFFSKRITFFDGEKEYQSFYTITNPTNVQQIPDSNLIAVNESNMFSIWDKRNNECIQLFDLPNKERLYGLTCKNEVVAIGGTGRVVTFYDVKTWTVRSHWKNCCKFEIGSVFLRNNDPNFAIASDFYSIVPSQYSNEKRHMKYLKSAIKFDSRVLGVDYNEKSNIIVGLSEKYTLYICDDRNYQERYTMISEHDDKGEENSED